MHRPASEPRAGFSLIELLVVITILGILAGLSYAVLSTAGAKARVNATKTTIDQINEVLQERYRKFNQDLTKQESERRRESAWGNILGDATAASSGALTVISLYNSGGNSPGTLTLDAAKALVRQDRYRGLFPQAGADLGGFDRNVSTAADNSPLYGNGTNGRLTSYVTKHGAALSDFTTSPEAESSELLYFIIVEGADGVASDILNNIPPKHVGDSDGDGLPEFLDDWGHPLRFYNAPTSMYADTSVATALFPGFSQSGKDPLDNGAAIGSFSNANDVDYFTGPYNLNFSAGAVTGLPFESAYHQRGVNFTPLIVSMGPDEDLGLYEPNDTTTATSRLGGVRDAGAATDNITNIQPAGGQ